MCRLLIAVAVLMSACFADGQQVSPQELFHKAEQAQQQGDNALALKKYQELVQLHPEIVAAHANLGVVLASLGRYDEAIAEYRFALQQAPDAPLLILNLGLAYYKKHDFAGAAAQFAVLHQQDSNNVRVATLLSDCKVQLGLAEQAVSILEPLDKTNANNLDLEWVLGRALIGTGRSLEGVGRVQKVAEQRHSEDAYQLAAQSYLSLTFFTEAKRDAEALLRLNPKSCTAYTILGMIADYAGNAKTAAENYQKALELNLSDSDLRIHLASALIDSGDLEAARQQLKITLESQPNSSGALYHLARIEKAEGNPTAALSDLEAAEHQDPQWLSPHIELAALYYRLKRSADGDREKAIVDQLREQERKRRAEAHVITPQVHPQ
jgi:tetratricopeptide (TPR) repeat protein